jgi:ParB family chromosome partitioning protein
MTDSLGISHTSIQLALVLADLPLAVVEAFATTLDLQYRWGKCLTEALQRDPEGILARAESA